MPSLNSYTSILGLRKAKHLLRRTTFNYSKNVLNVIANMTGVEAVNYLINNVTNNVLAEPFDPNLDGYWTSSAESPSSFSQQYNKRIFVTGWWWYNAYSQVSIKHKLSFFLHSCFTAAKQNGAGTSTHFYDYIRLLDFHAMGNVKSLAKKITLDNAMLDYLDNKNNNSNNPNENYAREFLELFTIQKGDQIADGDYTNYTELDVQQTAKVFTGFKNKDDRSILDTDTNLPKGYNSISNHDTSDKTFSSAFNNHTITGQSTELGMDQELDDFVEMVFAQQETARAYCRKLYRFFVKSEWDATVETDIIEPLAQQLLNNNYEILPTVTTLLSSQHFFDEDNTDNSDEIIGSIVKNPLQLSIEICSLFDAVIPDPVTSAYTYYVRFFHFFYHTTYLEDSGMSFFNPDTVAGYPANYQEPAFDRLWFSSNTIIARYLLMESFITGRNKIGNNATMNASIDTVSFVENQIDSPSDIVLLVTELSTLLYPEEIDVDRIDYFVQLTLDGYPNYYWTNTWTDYLSSGDNVTVKNRLDLLITAMVNAAEFQLM